MKNGTIVIHHMTREQIDMVEEAVAKLTENGWVVPGWIAILREFCKK